MMNLYNGRTLRKREATLMTPQTNKPKKKCLESKKARLKLRLMRSENSKNNSESRCRRNTKRS